MLFRENTGLSGLVTFWDYDDGTFWTWHGARRDVTTELTEPFRNRPDMYDGDVIHVILHVTPEGMLICGATKSTLR